MYLETHTPRSVGFISNRSTSINIRRVYVNLQTLTENMGLRAILSLDTAKAFDSLKWGHLWQVLEKFGFGPIFIGWLKIYYITSQVLN